MCSPRQFMSCIITTKPYIRVKHGGLDMQYALTLLSNMYSQKPTCVHHGSCQCWVTSVFPTSGRYVEKSLGA